MTSIVVSIDGQRLPANAKTFKTGSTGFWGGGKVVLSDGKTYQVSCSVVLVGSKGGSPVVEVSGDEAKNITPGKAIRG